MLADQWQVYLSWAKARHQKWPYVRASTRPQTSARRELALIIDVTALSPEEGHLWDKMLAALQLSADEYFITASAADAARVGAAIGVLVFDQDAAMRVLADGHSSDDVIWSHHPRVLLSQPQLKTAVWSQMKSALKRLKQDKGLHVDAPL